MALRLKPTLLICDIQERFRNGIYKMPNVISATNKILTAFNLLSLPVIVTTQQKRSLGETVKELNVTDVLANVDKTKFSMAVDEVVNLLPPGSPVVITGIESHICVLQTTLDLLNRGHPVYVLSDAVSSINPEERPIAFSRMAHAGAKITTTESILYEILGDASHPQFKNIIKLVKEFKESNKDNLQSLCNSRL